MAAAWVSGALCSAVFDIALGRTGKFASESVLGWWVWGYRSLVAPTFWALAAIVVVRLATVVAGLLGRITAVRRIGTGAAGLARSAAARLGLDNPIAAGQVLVVLQALTLGWVFWYFFDLIAAFTFTTSLSYTDPAALAPLAPDNFRHQEDYRSVLPLLIVAMVAAWVRVLRWRRRCRSQGDRASVVAGAAIVVALFFLAQVPYRIFNFSVFERVTLAGARCYAVGEGGSELLLYCPDVQAPRLNAVPAGDARLARTGIMESIFTARPAARPAPEASGAGRPPARGQETR